MKRPLFDLYSVFNPLGVPAEPLLELPVDVWP